MSTSRSALIIIWVLLIFMLPSLHSTTPQQQQPFADLARLFRLDRALACLACPTQRADLARALLRTVSSPRGSNATDVNVTVSVETETARIHLLDGLSSCALCKCTIHPNLPPNTLTLILTLLPKPGPPSSTDAATRASELLLLDVIAAGRRTSSVNPPRSATAIAIATATNNNARTESSLVNGKKGKASSGRGGEDGRALSTRGQRLWALYWQDYRGSDTVRLRIYSRSTRVGLTLAPTAAADAGASKTKARAKAKAKANEDALLEEVSLPVLTTGRELARLLLNKLAAVVNGLTEPKTEAGSAAVEAVHDDNDNDDKDDVDDDLQALKGRVFVRQGSRLLPLDLSPSPSSGASKAASIGHTSPAESAPASRCLLELGLHPCCNLYLAPP